MKDVGSVTSSIPVSGNVGAAPSSGVGNLLGRVAKHLDAHWGTYLAIWGVVSTILCIAFPLSIFGSLTAFIVLGAIWGGVVCLPPIPLKLAFVYMDRQRAKLAQQQEEQKQAQETSTEVPAAEATPDPAPSAPSPELLDPWGSLPGSRSDRRLENMREPGMGVIVPQEELIDWTGTKNNLIQF